MYMHLMHRLKILYSDFVYFSLSNVFIWLTPIIWWKGIQFNSIVGSHAQQHNAVLFVIDMFWDIDYYEVQCYVSAMRVYRAYNYMLFFLIWPWFLWLFNLSIDFLYRSKVCQQWRDRNLIGAYHAIEHRVDSFFCEFYLEVKSKCVCFIELYSY